MDEKKKLAYKLTLGFRGQNKVNLYLCCHQCIIVSSLPESETFASTGEACPLPESPMSNHSVDCDVTVMNQKRKLKADKEQITAMVEVITS